MRIEHEPIYQYQIDVLYILHYLFPYIIYFLWNNEANKKIKDDYL